MCRVVCQIKTTLYGIAIILRIIQTHSSGVDQSIELKLSARFFLELADPYQIVQFT